MQSRNTAPRWCAVAALGLCAGIAHAQDVAIVTIADAVRVAQQRSPALLPAELRREARRAERTQAELHPNPEAALEAENLTGSGSYRSAGSIELTGRVSQRIELGGKRTARTGMADAAIALADSELALARLDLARDAAAGLVEAVAAGRGAALDHDRTRLAEETLAAVRARIVAGREPPSIAGRAEAAVATARVAAARSSREADLARRRLALALGVGAIAIADNPPWFAAPATVPGLAETPTPLLAKADAELAKARARLEQELASAASDVTLSGGIRYYRDTQDAALVVGVSVPIPVRNRNQGAVAAARQELLAAEAERRLAERALAGDIAQARQQLELALAEAEVLQREAQPAAERAYQATRDGYAGGKLTLVDVLDAQRALIESRDQLNKALRDAHLRRIELARLTGAMPDAGRGEGG